MESPRTRMNVAMMYGAYYGLANVLVMFISYMLGADMQSKLPTLLNYILLVVFMTMAIKSHRDEDLGGYISYGKSVGTGILISVFGGAIVGVFSIVLFTLIDPAMTERILDTARQQMIENGLPDDQVEQAVEISRQFLTPIWLFVFGLVGSAVVGLILSLIVSVFTKREASPFDSNLG